MVSVLASPDRFSGRAGALLLAAALLAGLAGCGSLPRPSSREAAPPAPAPAREARRAGPARDLDRIPDAVPRVEPLAQGANRPYSILGRRYVPQLADEPYPQQGRASWYGGKFHGRKTSSGEIYDMYKMTAAHPTLPIPSYVRVRHLDSGRTVIVRVNDRGPFYSGRIIDLSYAAARRLDLVREGHGPVRIERITNAEILAGSEGVPDGAAQERVAELESRD